MKFSKKCEIHDLDLNFIKISLWFLMFRESSGSLINSCEISWNSIFLQKCIFPGNNSENHFLQENTIFARKYNAIYQESALARSCVKHKLILMKFRSKSWISHFLLIFTFFATFSSFCIFSHFLLNFTLFATFSSFCNLLHFAHFFRHLSQNLL